MKITWLGYKLLIKIKELLGKLQMLTEQFINLMKFKFIHQPNIQLQENIMIWKYKLFMNLYLETWKIWQFYLSFMKINLDLPLAKSETGIYLIYQILQFIKLITFLMPHLMLINWCIMIEKVNLMYLSLITNIWEVWPLHLVKKMLFGLLLTILLDKGVQL